MLGETFVERLRAARLPAKPYSIVLCARLVKGESIFSFLISHSTFHIRHSTFHIRHSLSSSSRSIRRMRVGWPWCSQ